MTSAPAAVAPDREFVVTAYVYNAAAGQKVTLEVPAGVELVGDAEQLNTRGAGLAGMVTATTAVAVSSLTPLRAVKM